MRIRRDSVFISAVLFTIALLCLLPMFLRAALDGRNTRIPEGLDAGYRLAAQTMGDLGIASLAIIVVALIVTWTGYAKPARSAWFVMFAFVWVWAFPLLARPLISARFKHTIVLDVL
jgi:hypothetical protein